MSLKLNGFGVEVQSTSRPEKLDRDGFTYVALTHHSEYSLRLTNSRGTPCDAEVSIDGEVVGTWRVDSYSSAVIDRPVHTERKFTFVKEGSRAARIGGLNTGGSDNGLIEVTFKPQKGSFYHVRGIKGVTWNKESTLCTSNSAHADSANEELGVPMSAQSFGYQSGGTVLGDRSDQRFNTVSRLTDIDSRNVTTISLRLVASDSVSRDPEYLPIGGSKQTPKPPRWDDGGVIMKPYVEGDEKDVYSRWLSR